MNTDKSTPALNSDEIPIDTLLNRTRAERRREHQYRFAQSVVFGLPVLALHALGHRLGGSEHARWVGLMQALLAGWVVYIGAAGMLFEGLLLLGRRRFSLDLPVAALAVALYLLSIIAWVSILLRGVPGPVGTMFHWSVAVLIAWCGVRWYALARADAPTR